MAVMKRSAFLALIDDHKARHAGCTDSAVAAHAQGRGYNLTKQDINNWRKAGRMPSLQRVDKVQAVAAALGVPPWRVAVAVLSDMGIDVPIEVRSPEDAVRADPTLSTQLRKQLLALLAIEREG